MTRSRSSTTNRPSTSPVRRLLAGVRTSPGRAWVALIFACVGSRLATTITYIEDPDSLRFALSVADEYDVAALQPHFPGYPVFWFVTELFATPLGRFSVSFSLVGGLATAGLIWALLRLRGVSLRSPVGFALAGCTFFSPLLWLMGNRYMPDLLGTAWALAVLVALLEALRLQKEWTRRQWAFAGIAGAGLLAGLRLSYMPLVFIPALVVLWRLDRRGRLIAAGTAGVLVWLVPMVLDTGLWTLVDVAWEQTTGHFTDFGGTVQTNPTLGSRLSGFLQGLWADGLGAWWPGRHPLTAVVGIGVLGTSGLGLRRLWNAGTLNTRRFWLLGASALLYAVWIFFFQNVVHKSRHVLPLLGLFLMLPAEGLAALWEKEWRTARAFVVVLAGAYVTVTLVLTAQHLNPSAVAQAKQFVERQTTQHEQVRVASVPLINEYLQAQQVEAQYFSIEDSTDLRTLRRADAGRTLVVGTYASLFDRDPTHVERFYHNPHVNRMWPEVTVYVYDY